MSYANEAPWDRALRIALGLVLVFLGWTEALPGLWAAAARVLAVVPLVTGIAGWSPLYAILGINTRKIFRHRRAAPRR